MAITNERIIEELVIDNGWNTGLVQSPGIPIVSFTFPSDEVLNQFPGDNREFSEGQKAAARKALAAWGAVCGIQFVEVPEDGSLWFFRTELGSNAGRSGYPPGEVDIALDFSVSLNPLPGSFAFSVLVHEIGHAMGLDHSFGLGQYDNSAYSVMSYTGPSDYVGPKPFDVVAVQYLYGLPDKDIQVIYNSIQNSIAVAGTSRDDTLIADHRIAALMDGGSGHDLFLHVRTSLDVDANGQPVYAWSSTEPIGRPVSQDTLIGGDGDDTFIFASDGNTAIIDGGSGTDTLDLSQVSGFLREKLPAQTFVLGSDGAIKIDSNWFYLDATGVERLVLGWGNQTIVGNNENNLLDGGIGDDTLDGGGGNDILIGGGAWGSDTALYTGIPSAMGLYIDSHGERIYVIDGPSGYDVLQGIGILRLPGSGQPDIVLDNLSAGGLFTPPSVELASDATRLSAGESAIITFTFSEAVAGLSVDQFMVRGGSLSNLQALDGSLTLYQATFTPDANFLGRGMVRAESLAFVNGAGRWNADGTDIDNTISFEINTVSRPALLTSGVVDHRVTDNIRIQFDSDISLTRLGSAGIQLKLGDTTVETFAAGSPLVRISGDTLIINPTANLRYDQTYTVVIGSGFVRNDRTLKNDTPLRFEVSTSDTAYTSANSFTLPTSASQIVYTGTGSFAGTGNARDNVITGGAGNDTLNGGAGADRLIGGLGDDTYVVDNALDEVVELPDEGMDRVRVMYTGPYILGNEVEQAIAAGKGAIQLTGNALDNRLTGNGAANVLNGLAGDDTLLGGAGLDVLDGGEGSDVYLIASATEHSGAEFSDTGSAGTDEVWFTNATAGSTLTLYAGDEGIERVRLVNASGAATSTVALNVNATAVLSALQIEGNNGANRLLGGSADDTLIGNAGNDRLDGGLGADSMLGGTGNDTYVVDDEADETVELAGEGTDTVRASVSWTLGEHIEHLVLTGSGDIDGTGNELANSITGNAGANLLDGGAGADTMTGGNGNDLYIVDHVGDQTIETNTSTTQFDGVLASISWTLGANIEFLELTGSADLIGTGNSLNNSMYGNLGHNRLDGKGGNDFINGGAGNDTLLGGSGRDMLTGDQGDDVLSGGAGNDTLEGGAGSDTFRFDSTPNASSNWDIVFDFESGVDTIELENTIFTSLRTTGELNAENFHVFTATPAVIRGQDANDFILYDEATGYLYYDRDSSGSTYAAVRFAQVEPGSTLSAADFLIT